MTTEKLDSATVATRASVYFDGKCVSHALTMPDGSKKSVGVVLQATLTFGTAAPEVMECTGGSCDYRLAGNTAWSTSVPGDQFSVSADTQFEIRVTEAYHYICHYG